MLDHVNCGNATLKDTQPLTAFDGVLGYFRLFSSLVRSAIGYPSRLLSSPFSHSFVSMDSPDLIDISSTDSDSDSDLRAIDDYRDSSDEEAASSIPQDVESQPSSSKRPNVSEDTSLRPHKRLNSSGVVGYSELGGIGNNHHRVGPNNYSSYSSHQPIKSTTPADRQPFSSDLQMDDEIEIVGTSKGHETHGRSYPSTARGSTVTGKTPVNGNLIREIGNNWYEKKGRVLPPSLNLGHHETHGRSYPIAARASTVSGKTPVNGNLNREIGNNSYAYEKKGRVLPVSLIPGQHASASPFIGSSDPLHHTGLGEEGAAEKFVLQAAMQDLAQSKAEINLPNGLLSVSLLRHQKIALAWMLKKESSGLCLGGILADDQGLGKTVSTIALIQMQKFLEEVNKNKRPSNTTTEALNLDDDDTGSGGCVQLDDTSLVEKSGDLSILPETGNPLKGFNPKRPNAGTLVVCPASVMRQWARELDEKIPQDRKLRVLIYHGPNRTKSPITLAKHHVVLTTYAIVTNEVPKQPLVEDDDELKGEERHGASSAFTQKNRKKHKKVKKGKKEIDLSAFDSNCGTLAKVKWSRVVLDESQTIKNHRTQIARACCSLRAKRRWCLSGTPIQNSVDELFSYFRFLRYDPYDKFKVFSANIKGKISRDSVIGYQKLQVVLNNIMLRRTKGTLIDGKPIINLPPKRIQLRGVDFSIEERNFYNKLESASKKQFKAYAAAGTVNQNYANILLMLLRLRQACDHPLLVKGFGSDPVGKLSCAMANSLPSELLNNLWQKLETSLAICLVCKDPPENAVVTMCGHVFCYQCVSDYMVGEDNTCPVPDCKEQLGADNVFSKSTLSRCTSRDNDSGSNVSLELGEERVVHSGYVSSKIKSALDILEMHCIPRSQSLELSSVVRNDGDASCSDDVQLNPNGRGAEKAIVFSQWTSMLDLVEISLNNSDINYRRLDGTMSIAARDKAVKDFNNDPKVDVMLMSLKAGNLGLNMVAASRVILLDLWWNPATEDQAIDRAHRIGQTRPVTVSRITIKNTIEDRILLLQDEKRKMVASAFGEDQSGGRATRLTAEDLRFLFEG